MTDRLRVVCVVAVLTLGLFLPAAAIAQDTSGKSAEVVKELVTILNTKVDAGMAFMAARISDGHYVGCLYLQSVPQLLVVTAQYEPAVLMDGRLAKKDYREAYTDLNSASKAGTRVFFEDLMANGLQPKREESSPFDMYTGADGKLVKFDGDPKAAKLSEEDYAKAYAAAEALYVKAAQALLAEAKKK